jgi:hypothetical protein
MEFDWPQYSQAFQVPTGILLRMHSDACIAYVSVGENDAAEIAISATFASKAPPPTRLAVNVAAFPDANVLGAPI